MIQPLLRNGILGMKAKTSTEFVDTLAIAISGLINTAEGLRRVKLP